MLTPAGANAERAYTHFLGCLETARQHGAVSVNQMVLRISRPGNASAKRVFHFWVSQVTREEPGALSVNRLVLRILSRPVVHVERVSRILEYLVTSRGGALNVRIHTTNAENLKARRCVSGWCTPQSQPRLENMRWGVWLKCGPRLH